MQYDLQQVTPVILTLNEEDNIERSLQSLSWAHRVVIVDSGSSDRTERIARSFKNVDWHVRAFDTHSQQWEFAIRKTGITSKYVLALDADMRTPDKFVRELERDFLASDTNAGFVGFDYWVLGRPIAHTLVPPQLRIFHREQVSIDQPGHTQTFSIAPPLYKFRSVLVHDDRKSLERFVHSQISYSRLEHERLLSLTNYSLKERLRRLALMPIVMAAVGYVLAGGPLRGSSSLCYALERVTYESLLAMRILRSGRSFNDQKAHYEK